MNPIATGALVGIALAQLAMAWTAIEPGQYGRQLLPPGPAEPGEISIHFIANHTKGEIRSYWRRARWAWRAVCLLLNGGGITFGHTVDREYADAGMYRTQPPKETI